jgi:polysaccharide biosynthesis/export protein
MKLAGLFACLTALSLGGCSLLPSAAPMASDVVAQGQAGDQILFDVVEVDEAVIATLRAQPRESFHARFAKDVGPPELKIAVGDTISVTIWESAAGGLFSEAPPEQPFTGPRPATEPLTPESQPPPTGPLAPGSQPQPPEAPGGLNAPPEAPFGLNTPPEAPGGLNPPLEPFFGAPNPPAGPPSAAPAPSPAPRPSGGNPASVPLSIEAATATSSRQGATIPDQQVGPDGAISVPYADRVPAAGRTPTEVQQTIEALLADKALGPQALVIVKKSPANAVTVTGEVVAGARVSLSPEGDRLLQLIAAAGGAKAPVYETFVRLSRNGVTAAIPLERLVADPAEDIYAQPGDVLTLVRVPQTFSVFGAAGRNAAIRFDAEHLTLSQALAKSQGLRDDLANPKGVFLFRYEPVSTLRALDQPMATQTQDGISPIAYRFNFADADSNFIADQFPVRDKDIIFVADAAAAQISKIFTVLNNITGPVITGIVTCHYVKC